jgi:RNA polymerase sigma-70 factor (ECF subfamily)
MDDDRNLDPEGWVDRHGDVMFRYALRWLHSSELAEEIVQESFLEALRMQGTYRGHSSERTWLVGILRHKLLDQARRSSRERAVQGFEATEADVLGRAFDRRGLWKSGPMRWRGDPSTDLERSEFWAVLGQCLARLPPGLSDAFWLHELEGLDGTATCETLQISPANLWQRLHRSRMLLRECLERQGFGEVALRPGKGRPCEGCRTSGDS